MTNKVYIFDSHPVQYKAPVYREINRIAPGVFEVIYASDFSVRAGSVDRGFGVEVKWDVPLLSGYDFRVLGNGTGTDHLSGKGVFRLLKEERPRAVVLTHTRYQFDRVAYLSALALGIPILVRQETQDQTHANERTALKSLLRGLAYRVIYAPVKHAFCFGELNRLHLERHGISPSRMSMAHFSVANPLKDLGNETKWAQRAELRERLGIPADAKVLGFFGKLIPVKNPSLIYHSLQHVPAEQRRELHLLFVGSGQMENVLRELASEAEDRYGVHTVFAGFINQQQLHQYYLATDIVALPSKREAWGLVINEALDAGNAVVMTDTVGCHHEFGTWERTRVVPEGDASALGKSIAELARYERSLEWAAAQMEPYSTESAARDMARVFKSYTTQG